MKKIIAILLTLAFVLSMTALVGCGEQPEGTPTEAENLETAELSNWTTVRYDPAVCSVDGYQIDAADGSWWISVHESYDADDKDTHIGYFDKIEQRDDATISDSGDKMLGAYDYKYLHYVANAQYFGNYYFVFEPPMDLDFDYQLHGIFIDYWADELTDDVLAQIEAVISTLTVSDENKRDGE